MKRKPPAARNIGIDIDPKSIEQFECNYPVELINNCACKFLSGYHFEDEVLIYCDPPYLKSTRSSNRQYRYDYEEQDHVKLIHLLLTLPCKIIVSGYPSSLYDQLLSNWNALELQAMNHNGVRTEKLWFNFEIERHHWSKYAGKNFTDRQRIKRKAQRWGKNYQALSPAERLSVLAAIMDIESIEQRQSKG